MQDENNNFHDSKKNYVENTQEKTTFTWFIVMVYAADGTEGELSDLKI